MSIYKTLNISTRNNRTLKECGEYATAYFEQARAIEQSDVDLKNTNGNRHHPSYNKAVELLNELETVVSASIDYDYIDGVSNTYQVV